MDKKEAVIRSLAKINEGVRGEISSEDPVGRDTVRNAVYHVVRFLNEAGFFDDRMVPMKMTHYDGCYEHHLECAGQKIKELMEGFRGVSPLTGCPIEVKGDTV